MTSVPPPARIRLMVVDDSALVRQVIAQAVAHDPQIELVATASDPLFALEKLKQVTPDVIVLDIEMPRMDGLTFLRRIMAERPTPVIICSTLAEKGAATTIEAMAAGAVSVIGKPRAGLKSFLEDASGDLVATIKAAARANLRALASPDALLRRPQHSADVILPAGRTPGPPAGALARVVAIGTSTGGTQALEALLTRLPTTAPGIVVVQHMPEKFTTLFAERLNGLCRIEVREAVDRDRVEPGRALIAPGGKHLLLRRSGAQYHVEVVDGPLVNRHKPSVDVLFRSVARCAGGNALGILLTGMGDDGARGLAEMRAAGAATIAQDEQSCVVFGMPREAIRLGAAERVLPLDQIPAAIIAAGNAP